MKLTLSQIAQKIGGKLRGDGKTEIEGVAGLEEARPGQLSFLAGAKYRQFLTITRASAVILPESEGDTVPLPQIIHPNPYFAFAQAVKFFHPETRRYPAGIHPTAIVGEKVTLGKNVHIGPYVVIEEKVEIGENSTIGAGSFIGAESKLGKEVYLYPRVTIYHNCSLGQKVIVHSGAVIGSDGFGFAMDKGKHYKIPQIGNVVIEDEVEIGANCTIDRAALGTTRIGRGTKLDNLVHVGHSVEIGENSILVAQVGISGSTKLGQNVTLGGQAGLVGHINLGDFVRVGAQAGVTKSVPAGTAVSGYPAREHGRAKRIEACISNLPDYVARIRELEEKLSELKQISET